MDAELLQIIWFVLIVVLFVGFFFFEGFDYGVGILLPFVGKDEKERRIVNATIGPHWDANEVWMITAGGAMFAAFPQWYATLFSGFYLALFLMLAALIIRGLGFEYRNKHESEKWRNTWDWIIFAGSLIPALLWGVAFSNVVKGLAIDKGMNYTGTFFDLLNPYALVGGMVTLFVFTMHGANFLKMKTQGEIKERSADMGLKAGLIAVVFGVTFIVMSIFFTDMFSKAGGVLIILTALTLLGTVGMMKVNKDGWAFTLGSLTVALFTLALFFTLFPRVMVSSIPGNDLTIANASSSPYTLKVMFIVALIFVPIVLVYLGWTYKVFKDRITKDNIDSIEY